MLDQSTLAALHPLALYTGFSRLQAHGCDATTCCERVTMEGAIAKDIALSVDRHLGRPQGVGVRPKGVLCACDQKGTWVVVFVSLVTDGASSTGFLVCDYAQCATQLSGEWW